MQKTPLRTPRAAEALAASARKSEPPTPLGEEDAGVSNGLPDATRASSDPEHLLQSDSVTATYKALFRDLRTFQRGAHGTSWPRQKREEENALYQRLYKVRTAYKKAISGKAEPTFTIDDLCLFSCLPGSGPEDHALGKGMLGHPHP